MVVVEGGWVGRGGRGWFSLVLLGAFIAVLRCRIVWCASSRVTSMALSGALVLVLSETASLKLVSS